jgi:hypothetical protein
MPEPIFKKGKGLTTPKNITTLWNKNLKDIVREMPKLPKCLPSIIKSNKEESKLFKTKSKPKRIKTLK